MKITVTISIEEELIESVKTLAITEGRSTSNYIEQALKEVVEKNCISKEE